MRCRRPVSLTGDRGGGPPEANSPVEARPPTVAGRHTRPDRHAGYAAVVLLVGIAGVPPGLIQNLGDLQSARRRAFTLPFPGEGDDVRR